MYDNKNVNDNVVYLGASNARVAQATNLKNISKSEDCCWICLIIIIIISADTNIHQQDQFKQCWTEAFDTSSRISNKANLIGNITKAKARCLDTNPQQDLRWKAGLLPPTNMRDQGIGDNANSNGNHAMILLFTPLSSNSQMGDMLTQKPKQTNTQEYTHDCNLKDSS